MAGSRFLFSAAKRVRLFFCICGARVTVCISDAVGGAMSETDASQKTLPILDLRRFEKGGAEREAFLDDLGAAARDVGFFYLTGHGIAQARIDDVLRTSRAFFSLPEDDKLEIGVLRSPHFRGQNYGAGDHGKRDWRDDDIGRTRLF